MWKDSETKVDYLDFEYLTKALIDIVKNDSLSPSSIGVYGDWGSGKSSLMQMSMEELSKEEDTLCIKFNGWLFEGYEDAKTALLGTILDKINKEKTPTGKAKEILQRLYKNTDKLKLASMGIKYGVDFLVTGGIGSIADITLKSVLSKVKSKASEINQDDISKVLNEEFKSEEIRRNIKEFQTDFSGLLKETKIIKLVVFVDELDRCNPSTILDTLEAIRLFLFTEHTSFIIGADERHVTYAVKKKYSEIEGNQIDIGKEYLEKMIQYPIRIPQLGNKEVEFYILSLILQNQLEAEEFKKVLDFIAKEKKGNFIEFELTYEALNKALPEVAEKSKEAISLAKQLSSVLAAGLNGNPRHCKRFLNSLSMREGMAKYRNVELNRKVLAKLMLLEYFKSDFFRKLASLQSVEKGKPKELGLMENNNWDEVKVLKLGKDEKWIQGWLKLEPKLSEHDLRPYFYFSRESLASQLNLGQYRLSPTAEKALADLLSGADTQRNNALKAAININDSEANVILEKLSSQILSEESIDNKVFRSLLEFGASKESLFTGVINCLQEISGGKIDFSVIPRIKHFMDKTKKESEIKEIAKRWKNENNKLTKVIDKDILSEGDNGNIK